MVSETSKKAISLSLSLCLVFSREKNTQNFLLCTTPEHFQRRKRAALKEHQQHKFFDSDGQTYDSMFDQRPSNFKKNIYIDMVKNLIEKQSNS
jgi:hypothetical protein